MNCPNCGSETWNNTEKVAGGWKGPLFKCKDQGCGWLKWPPKDKPRAQGRSNGAPKWTWRSLQDTYRNSLRIAATLVPTLVKNATPESVVSGAATIFIAASRDGVAPLKPQEQSLDEKPQQLNDDDTWPGE